jgi:hypothetical protein
MLSVQRSQEDSSKAGESMQESLRVKLCTIGEKELKIFGSDQYICFVQLGSESLKQSPAPSPSILPPPPPPQPHLCRGSSYSSLPEIRVGSNDRHCIHSLAPGRGHWG